jgi:hypothetical protein
MRYCEPTEKQLRGWKRWVRKLPKQVRGVAERFEPWSLYRLKTTGHRVTVHSFGDDATITVIVSGRWNKVAFERQVFGIQADELEDCELPGPGEPLGAVMTSEEAKDNLDELKVMVRPDLWALDEDGKAVRKQ